MSKIIQDLKGTKGIMLFVPIIYYGILLLFILLADKEYPPDPMKLNEMGMIPFVIIITSLLYQRELSGLFMEIYSTYPISFTWMILRKIVETLIVTFVAHYLWVQIYLVRFNNLQAIVYPENGGHPYFAEVTWAHLFLEAFPEYLLMISLSLFVMMISKKFFAGFLAGFSYWMLESISRGSLTKAMSLFVADLPKDVPYYTNRLYLGVGSLFFLVISLFLINRRERWIITEEID